MDNKGDFSFLSEDQIEEIGKKLWEQCERGEWHLTVESVIDVDPGTESSTLCYKVCGKNLKNDNSFYAFPDSIPMYAYGSAFVIIAGKNKFVSQHFPKSRHFNLLYNCVKNLVSLRKNKDKKREEEKEKSRLKDKNEELFKSIMDSL